MSLKKKDQTLFSSTHSEIYGCVLISLEESNGSDEGEDASGGNATGSSGDNGGLGALRGRVGTGGVDGDGAGGSGRSGVLGLARLSGVLGVAGSGSGGVRSGNLGLARLTRLAGGGHGVRVLGLRLGDCARAVGNGESGGLSDGVGLVAVGESGRLRAVGGESGDDLSGVDHRREDRLCGLEGVGDCAGAVGDGQGGLLGDGVGLVTVGEGGGSRAVGCDGGNNLCGVVSTVAVDGVGRGLGSSDEEASGGGSLEERHFEIRFGGGGVVVVVVI
jgi:hypothetical protein